MSKALAGTNRRHCTSDEGMLAPAGSGHSKSPGAKDPERGIRFLTPPADDTLNSKFLTEETPGDKKRCLDASESEKPFRQNVKMAGPSKTKMEMEETSSGIVESDSLWKGDPPPVGEYRKPSPPSKSFWQQA